MHDRSGAGQFSPDTGKANPFAEPRDQPRGGDFEPSRPDSADRTNFFDEQKRRRRTGRILALVCLLIAGGIGVVLSAVVTPMLLLAGGGLLRLLARFGIMPARMHDAVHGLGTWANGHSAHFQELLDSLDHVNRLSDLTVTLTPLRHLAPVCIPALVAACVVWIVLRRIARRAEGGDLITRLHARPPNPLDLEERQLGNIIAEMAISAGLPEPRLLLIDRSEINAAAVGSGRAHATLLVTRGLLDQLDRDETSGIVAHLIASIGAGDVRLTHAILAVFQTLGFFMTFLDLPFRWSAWQALGGMVLVMLGLRRSPEKMEQTLELLEFGMDASAMPDVEHVWSVIPSVVVRKILLVPLLPLILVSIIMRLVLFLWTALFLGPPLAMIWRNRRYAADAMAVQLTRNPDGLARALSQIGDSGVPEGGEGREYYFVHGSSSSPKKRDGAARGPITGSLHPSLARRLRRLHALGAMVGGERPRRFQWEQIAQHPAQMLLGLFLMLLLIPLLGTLVVAVLYLTAIAMTLGLAAGLTITAAVLG
jgi:Zn-dependent protease with chaperone function